MTTPISYISYVSSLYLSVQINIIISFRGKTTRKTMLFSTYINYFTKNKMILLSIIFIFHKIIVRTLKVSGLETCGRKTRTILIWRLYYEKYVHLTALRVYIGVMGFPRESITTCGRYKVRKLKICTVVLFGSAKTSNGWLSEIPLVELMV